MKGFTSEEEAGGSLIALAAGITSLIPLTSTLQGAVEALTGEWEPARGHCSLPN